MNIEEILQDMIRNDDEQDKEASEWMSEGGVSGEGGGGHTGPLLGKLPGIRALHGRPQAGLLYP